MRPWEHLLPNPANVELDWNDSYGERIDKIAAADAVVALPGGVGTLAEWTLAWMSIQTENQPRVLVLVGERWSNLVSRLSGVLFADQKDYAHLDFADEPDEIVDRIWAVCPVTLHHWPVGDRRPQTSLASSGPARGPVSHRLSYTIA